MSAKGQHYPNMPPLFDGEDNDHYSNRLIGVYGEDAYPYDHVRNRQCALGWHNECSERTITNPSNIRRCQCPCHAYSDPAALTDEELAAIEERCRPRSYAGPPDEACRTGDCGGCERCWGPGLPVFGVTDVSRLIAALRASRAEVERLRSLTDELTQAAHSHLP